MTLAIARGRIQQETTVLLKKAGYAAGNIPKNSRKLIFDFPGDDMRVFIIRPTDVPSYVEYGAADCGIVGLDTLLEEKFDLYEPLDLKIARCKLVVAGSQGFELTSSDSLRVATKYPKIAGNFFRKKGVNAEVFKLYGSVELAPIVGLSDVIVDLSATGETLKKHDLTELEIISEISARLIVNRVSMKVKSSEIKEFIDRLDSVR